MMQRGHGRQLGRTGGPRAMMAKTVKSIAKATDRKEKDLAHFSRAKTVKSMSVVNREPKQRPC